MSRRDSHPAFSGLYGIVGPVNARLSADRIAETEGWARVLLQSGAKVLQLRDKDSDGRTLLESARRLRGLTREAGVIFIVNDRLDIALMSQADGVHVGQDDLPVEAVREVAERTGRSDLIVGLSTHDLQQVQSAVALPVDYIGFGPVFSTSTKSDALRPRGPGMLSEAVELAGTLPVVAIGGITLGNLAAVLESEAAMAAVIGDIVHASAPLDRATELHRLLSHHRSTR